MSAVKTLFPPPPAAGDPGDPGILGPDSVAWHTLRERALLAAGPAALLLQVGHPLVAAGVSAHSDFSADPLRRLRGTLDAFLTVTFGDRAQVAGAARHVAGRHRTVQGVLPVATGPIPAGTPYRAADPDLALWVFATLVWCSVEVTDAFIRPVAPPERDEFYRDMIRLARVFRVPARILPDRYAALERYVQDQVHDVLTVGPTAARLAGQILAPDPPLFPWPARTVPGLLAAGVLPGSLRVAYGLPWRDREQAAFSAARRVTRHVVPLLPPRLRVVPHYLVAAARVAPSGTGSHGPRLTACGAA